MTVAFLAVSVCSVALIVVALSLNWDKERKDIWGLVVLGGVIMGPVFAFLALESVGE